MNKTPRRFVILVSFTIDLFIVDFAQADSMRCKGNLVDVGNSKSEVVKKCGEPESTDAYCEKRQQRVPQMDGTYVLIENCENVEVWTYDRGRGKFTANLIFSEGKIREIREGDRGE